MDSATIGGWSFPSSHASSSPETVFKDAALEEPRPDTAYKILCTEKVSLTSKIGDKTLITLAYEKNDPDVYEVIYRWATTPPPLGPSGKVKITEYGRMKCGVCEQGEEPLFALADDGQRFAVQRYGIIAVCDTLSGETIATLPIKKQYPKAGFYNSNTLVTPSCGSRLMVWNISSPKADYIRLEDLPGGLWRGRRVFFFDHGKDQGTVRDFHGDVRDSTLNRVSDMNNFTFSPDGNYLAATNAEGLRIWNIHQREPIFDLDCENSAHIIPQVSFSLDNKRLIMGSTGRLQIFKFGNNNTPVDFSPRNWSSGYDVSYAVTFGPQKHKNWVAAAGGDYGKRPPEIEVKIWDVSGRRKEIGRLSWPEYEETIKELCFLPGGRFLLAQGWNSLRLLQISGI